MRRRHSTVHWGYPSEILRKFGFSSFIHEAIMSLYRHPSANVFTSGIVSNSFNLTNGTRQGCPLSPIFFSLAIEPLAETIRSNVNITGIKIGKRTQNWPFRRYNLVTNQFGSTYRRFKTYLIPLEKCHTTKSIIRNAMLYL